MPARPSAPTICILAAVTLMAAALFTGPPARAALILAAALSVAPLMPRHAPMRLYVPALLALAAEAHFAQTLLAIPAFVLFFAGMALTIDRAISGPGPKERRPPKP